MFRDSLLVALERTDRIQVIGSAMDVTTGRSLLGEMDADVAVIDYGLPDGVGTELVREMTDAGSQTRVLVLTAHEGIEAAAGAIAAGAAGFVRKSAPVDELVTGITRVADGSAYFDAQTLTAVATRPRTAERTPPVELTDRELEVLRLLASGYNAEDITRELVVSPHTTRNHIRNALSKLNARSQLEAVVTAATMGLVVVGK